MTRARTSCVCTPSAGRADASARVALAALAVAWEGFSDLWDLYQELADAFLVGDGRSVSGILSSHAGSHLQQLVGDAGPGLTATYSARLERDLPAKFRRMRRVQTEVGALLSPSDLLANIEGAVRAAFYMAIRHRYNGARLGDRWDAFRSADFLFLREFAYAAMFRFNGADEFNVPYGGVSYNRKSLAHKVRLMFTRRHGRPARGDRMALPRFRALPRGGRPDRRRLRVRRPAL